MSPPSFPGPLLMCLRSPPSTPPSSGPSNRTIPLFSHPPALLNFKMKPSYSSPPLYGCCASSLPHGLCLLSPHFPATTPCREPFFPSQSPDFLADRPIFHLLSLSIEHPNQPSPNPASERYTRYPLPSSLFPQLLHWHPQADPPRSAPCSLTANLPSSPQLLPPSPPLPPPS